MSADKVIAGIGKGVSTISEVIFPKKKIDEILKPSTKPTTTEQNWATGLYLRKNTLNQYGLIPHIDFFEPQTPDVSFLGKIKNLSLSASDKFFYDACRNLVYGLESKAIDLFHKALDKDPQLADAYFMLGIIEKSTEKKRDPRENLSKALLLHNNLGKTLKNALPTFRLILPVTSHLSFAIYADLVGVNILLALAERAAKSNEHLKIMQQILDLLPGSGTLSFFYSLFLYERGKREKIVPILKGILPDSQGFELNYLMLAKILYESGDYSVASELLKRVISNDTLDPDLACDYKNLLSFCENAQKGLTASSPEILLLKRLEIIAPDPSCASSQISKKKKSSTSEKTNSDVDSKLAVYCKENSMRYSVASKLIIGKGADVDLNLEWDDLPSEKHAILTRENGTIFIEPLDKENVIFINKFKITKKISLNKGDEITIGNTVLFVR